MSKKTILAATLALSILLTLSAFPQSTEPAPGGIRLRAETNQNGQFTLEIDVTQSNPEDFTILAVSIYTEPSHALLVALVDDNAPVSVLQDVQAGSPRSLATCSIGASSPLIGVSAPPAGDTDIQVVYTIRQDEEITTMTAAEGRFKSLEEFHFLSEPDEGGGPFHFCGWCGEEFCGCVNCSKPQFTVCCPDCYIVCGLYVCP